MRPGREEAAEEPEMAEPMMVEVLDSIRYEGAMTRAELVLVLLRVVVEAEAEFGAD
jgi:hypothetical protein